MTSASEQDATWAILDGQLVTLLLHQQLEAGLTVSRQQIPPARCGQLSTRGLVSSRGLPHSQKPMLGTLTHAVRKQVQNPPPLQQ
jgi:hypothetical protein